MISAVTDAATNWVLTHVTPSARYWGLAHEEEFFLPAILASWASLGITALGPVVTVETSSPPYGFTHTLATDLTPRRNGTFHLSTALDRYTPLNKDHTPALADAWGYMMSE